jgi:hypothetical protein
MYNLSLHSKSGIKKIFNTTVLHSAAEKYVFSNAYILSHRQDVEVLLTVFKFTFALVYGENYQLIIFTFLSSAFTSTLAIFWRQIYFRRKTVLPPATGRFLKFLLEKPKITCSS